MSKSNNKSYEQSIYCGIGDLPVNSRRGSMKECIENKQVRYYGIEKINPKILDQVANEKKEYEKLLKLRRQYTSINGKIAGLKRQREFSKDKSQREALREEINKLIKEKNKFVDEYNDLDIKIKNRQKKEMNIK